MKLDKSIIVFLIVTFFSVSVYCQQVGAESLSEYLPFLKNKNVALVVNHASQLKQTHLVDTLVALDVEIEIIFSPEHGFSGNFNAGEHFVDSLYNDTIPIRSLYTKKEIQDIDVQDVDVVVFDLQDVGVRFYTYLSTLHYVMEGCARNNIKLIVLDRINPHAHYVDGPILDLDYASFVGMHPVPIVYGMTIGEYALMINGEGWLTNNLICDLSIVKNNFYSRSQIVDISIDPSPNLRSMNAIFLYPSLCLFEGTSISVGRGTETPFELYGSPFLKTLFSFIPVANFGSRNPKYKNQLCYGVSLEKRSHQQHAIQNKINIDYLLSTYNLLPREYKKDFFNSFFDKLAGSSELRESIINNMSESEIRLSWQSDIDAFLLIRSKYLLYD